MPLSDFTGPDRIDDWIAHLDDRWPERVRIRQCTVNAIERWLGETQVASPHLLELGVGNGDLACSLLDRLTRQGRTPSYTAVDVNEEMIDFALERIRSTGHDRAVGIVADLNDLACLRALPPVDVAFSLQTLHDLDGLEALQRIYAALYAALRPGGLTVNADFIAPFPNDDPDRPRRFPVAIHQELLLTAGYVDFTSTTRGQLSCMTAVRQ